MSIFVFPDFKIGTILAKFMLSESVPVKNDWLKICARGTATSYTVVLIIFIDKLSKDRWWWISRQEW